MCSEISNIIKFSAIAAVMTATVVAYLAYKAKECKKEKGVKRKFREAIGAMEEITQEVRDKFLS